MTGIGSSAGRGVLFISGSIPTGGVMTPSRAGGIGAVIGGVDGPGRGSGATFSGMTLFVSAGCGASD